MEAGMKVKERRELERFELTGPARIMLESGVEKGRSYSLTTRDVSSGGAFLLSPRPVPVGTDVRVEFVLSLDLLNRLVSEGGRARVRVKGKVIRTGPDGIAVRFKGNYKITSLDSSGSGGELP